jgi:hypothetical protein
LTRFKVGDIYDGLSAFSADPANVDVPGFYALDDDGKDFRKPLRRLVCVASGESHYFKVASKDDPAQMTEGTVDFDAHSKGLGGTEL